MKKALLIVLATCSLFSAPALADRNRDGRWRDRDDRGWEHGREWHHHHHRYEPYWVNVVTVRNFRPERRVYIENIYPQPVVMGGGYPSSYCREYQGVAQIGYRREATFGTACLMPDGSWQIVN